MTLRDSLPGSWGDVRSVFVSGATASAAGSMLIASAYANFVGVWELNLKVQWSCVCLWQVVWGW